MLASSSRANDEAPTAPAPAEPLAPAPAIVEAPAKKKLLRVAVYDLAVDGVDARVGRLVTNAIVTELRKLQGVSVVSMDEVRSMLRYEADKQLLGCEAAKPCHSAVGDALGVDQLVVGELGSVGGESVISLRRIDQAAARSLDGFTQRLAPEDGEEFLAAVGPATQKLFPELPVREGLTRGVAPELALLVNPPPVPAWATVATGVGATVVLVAGVVCGASALSEQAAHDSLEAQALKQPVPAALLTEAGDRAQSWALAANGLYVGAALVGLGAAVMVPFTDWSGAGAARLE